MIAPSYYCTIGTSSTLLFVAYSACARGSYGKNCAGHCRCRSDAACDPVTGACRCRMGFAGDQCDVPCDRDHYGPGCLESCNCQNGAACDPVTGCCDCTSGWYGQHCQLGMWWWWSLSSFICSNNDTEKTNVPKKTQQSRIARLQRRINCPPYIPSNWMGSSKQGASNSSKARKF